MTWPNQRRFTYAPGLPVRSSDLNAIQDAIIGAKHGDVSLWIGPEHARGDDTPLANPYDIRDYFLGAAVKFYLPLAAGTRLKSVAFGVRDKLNTPIQIYVYRTKPAINAPTLIGTGTQSNRSGTDQRVLLTGFTGPVIVAPGECLYVWALGEPLASPYRFYGAELVVDRP